MQRTYGEPVLRVVGKMGPAFGMEISTQRVGADEDPSTYVSRALDVPTDHRRTLHLGAHFENHAIVHGITF